MSYHEDERGERTWHGIYGIFIYCRMIHRSPTYGEYNCTIIIYYHHLLHFISTLTFLRGHKAASQFSLLKNSLLKHSCCWAHDLLNMIHYVTLWCGSAAIHLHWINHSLIILELHTLVWNGGPVQRGGFPLLRELSDELIVVKAKNQPPWG